MRDPVYYMHCAARSLLNLCKLTLQALHSGVSCVSNRARAAGGVASRLADGVSAARVHVTRVTTRAIVTFVWVTTITIRDTRGGGGHCNKQTRVIHMRVHNSDMRTFRFTFSVRSNERVIWTRAEDSSDG